MILRKVIVAIAICSNLLSLAQSPELNLLKWSQTNPIEKLYLHLDRDNYTAGQTIWFKGYFLSEFIPSSKSTALNIELLNEDSKLILRKVFPVVMSEGYGQLELPEDLASGTYQLRAYSPLMANQPGFYFAKKITVFGKQPKSTAKEAASPATNITFFPEGGNLITMLLNNVAFKAVDEKGLPIDVKLDIHNNKNELITSVSTSYDGMGYFSIVPQNNESYYATVANQGSAQKYDLPTATQRGVTLNVRNNTSGKIFKIEQLPDNETFKAAYMIGQMQNTVVFRQELKSGKNLFSGIIPTGNLLSGILQITVFNKDNMPLAERLTFIDNKEYILPAIFNADTLNTGERKRNHYSISLPDTVIGNFSVSITDADYETSTLRDQNIFSYYLLSSDLRGYIHNPSNYFTEKGVKNANIIELLMMTNGWTRFKWQDAVKNTLPAPVYKDNGFITLNGRINIEGTKKPFANKELIYFMMPQDTSLKKRGTPRFISTDSLGRFTIDSQFFFGKMNILFSDIKGKKSKFIKVNLDNDSLYKNYNLLPVKIPFTDSFKAETVVKMTDYYNDYLRAEGLMLDRVTVKTRSKSKEQLLEDNYASGLFAGGVNSRILDLSDETTGAFNIFEYIQGRIAGVNVTRNDTGEYIITYRDGGFGNNRLQLFLDEMQTDASFIESIPVNQIAYVKLMGNFVGAQGGGGALAIYMKKGADLNAVTESATDIVPYNGYEVLKEFYSPNYDVRKPEDSKADTRLTLLWHPLIYVSNVNGKIPVVFYNNDRTKKFKIVAEGFTNDGRFLMIEKIVNP